jgi:hypothetical protein
MILKNYNELIKMKKILVFILSMCVLLVNVMDLNAQGKLYDGPEDGAGDPYLEREAFMSGNRVQLLFKNNTELGDHPRQDAARWPRGPEGNLMHDGLGLLVSAAIYITNDSIVVTDPNEIQRLSDLGEIDTLFYCQTSYREEMDIDPTGQVEWGFHAVPGYMNNLSDIPAMSNDENSWPLDGWPYKGREKHWAGEWDGRFGRGQIKSDLEAYSVANDAQDLEYLGDDDKVKYYPRKDVLIGDIDPSVTVQKGRPWGGLGVRVKQRGFQWNNAMAQDCIFWEYTIANISDNDIPHMAFGYWLDNNIGGENTGDDGNYDKELNLTYCWDTDGVGNNGYKTGTAGYAYLESPGIFNDNKDNDDDGLMDEKRDNSAGSFIDKYAGIEDMDKFLSFYGKDEEELKDHWEGDEDQDWNDGVDENGDGIYQDEEVAGDDIGLDGVGPTELNYTGPDADGTECNHKPDLGDGYAEPNFGWTDVSETDMLGLTTLLFYDVPAAVEPYTNWFRHDESMYKRMTTPLLQSGATHISNLFQLFSTATFPLYKGHTEFISISELHSFDDLTGLISAEKSAPALITLKNTVQLIYEKDYRFAQPPLMPTLTAVPGDGFVQLMWTDKSDKLTRESFLGGINDFEGYKIYRSTDPDMLDARVITDGYGTNTLLKPIFQCDKRDDYKGFTSWGLLNGAAYYLGENTGIAYSFKDETVQNGRTYYYAIIAYDYGIKPEMLKGSSVVAQDDNAGIAPSENNVVIRTDEYEDVKFIGPNVAIVTPGTSAAGEFIKHDFEVNDDGVIGDGQIIPKVLDINSLKEGHTYKIKFSTILDSVKTYNISDDPAANYNPGYRYQYNTNGIMVYDETDNGKLVLGDTLTSDGHDFIPRAMRTVIEKEENGGYHLASSEMMWTEIFDGLQLGVKMDVTEPEFDSLNTGWMQGNSSMKIIYNQDVLEMYKWDYNIVFSDQTLYNTKITERWAKYIKDENGESIVPLVDVDLNLRVDIMDFADSAGNPLTLDILVDDQNGNGVYDKLEDRIMIGPLNTRDYWEGFLFILDFTSCQNESELPQANDAYTIRYTKPWFKTDSLSFHVSAEKMIDENAVKTKMDDIRVVPNPYVSTNMMEPSVINKDLNQSRRLLFTNLPENSTIKIFTISGMLIRELHSSEDGLTSYSGLGLTSSGVLHWDLRSWEGLDVAAGMYFYHVKDEMTGEEKIGKFAIIK